jgi:hypothetical protein
MLKKHDVFILAAVAVSFAFSVTLWFGVDPDAGLFVGIWVPSILGLGAYLRLMKKEARDVA